MDFYRHAIRPILFRCDPEWIHNRVIGLGQGLGDIAPARKALARMYGFVDPRLSTTIAGIEFPNPLGLAAGFDKNGRSIETLSMLGFGFIEIGSISAKPSQGNPRPRLFRLPRDDSIVVNYGVPNDGAPVVAQRIADRQTAVPLGVNLVETNTGQPATPEQVIQEFAESAEAFATRADYLALNLNCPNTTAGQSVFEDPVNLRDLMHTYGRLAGIPPVFLKVTAQTDAKRIEQTLEAIEPFPFVAGLHL